MPSPKASPGKAPRRASAKRTAAPARRSPARRAPARKVAKKKKKKIRCKGRRYGSYCLGRVIGPQIQHRNVKCPHDNHVFRVTIKANKWQPRYYDSDLRPHMGHYRFVHRVWICRKCSYAAYGKDFFKPYDKRLMEKVLERNRRYFSSRTKIPVSYRFRLAQSAYWVRKKGTPFVVRLMLHAMYAGREQNQLRYSQKIRKHVIAGLTLAFKKKLYPKAKKPRMAYLLAELLRQEGKFQKSLQWVEKAFLFLRGSKPKKPNFTQKKRYQWLEKIILSCQRKAASRDRKIYVLR